MIVLGGSAYFFLRFKYTNGYIIYTSDRKITENSEFHCQIFSCLNDGKSIDYLQKSRRCSRRRNYWWRISTDDCYNFVAVNFVYMMKPHYDVICENALRTLEIIYKIFKMKLIVI